jgi:hypothetical protein
MELQKYEQIKAGFVDWLEPYNWNWWGTLEFSPQKPLKDPIRAKKYFTDYVKNNLDQPDQPWCSYFMSVEHFKSNFFTHIHFMLSGICEGLSEKNAGKAIGGPWWKKYGGYCYLQKFDSKLGAAGYLAKYVTKDLCDWDIRVKPEHRKDYFLFGG